MNNKKSLYFLCYNPSEDRYHLEFTNNYTINDWGYYVLHGGLYNEKNKMVFNSLKEAKKELKKANKTIIFINVKDSLLLKLGL